MKEMVSPGVGGRDVLLAWCAETAILVLREPCRARGNGCAGSDQGRPSRDPLLFGVLRYSPSGPCSPEFWVFVYSSDWFSATPYNLQFRHLASTHKTTHGHSVGTRIVVWHFCCRGVVVVDMWRKDRRARLRGAVLEQGHTAL